MICHVTVLFSAAIRRYIAYSCVFYVFFFLAFIIFANAFRFILPPAADDQGYFAFMARAYLPGHITRALNTFFKTFEPPGVFLYGIKYAKKVYGRGWRRKRVEADVDREGEETINPIIET